jgi:tetratricopeptide (TPR) repeat protein
MSKMAGRYYLFPFSTIIFTMLFFAPNMLCAQNIDKGITYYQQNDYQKAVSVFKELSSPKAYLYLGKSHYALGKYQKVLADLNKINSNDHPQFYNEAVYTAALANFQQKKFGQSLNKLYKVSQDSSGDKLASMSQKLYRQILHYLSARQRNGVIAGNFKNPIKYDVLKSAMGKMSYHNADSLYHTFYQNIHVEKWRSRAKKFQPNLRS